MPLLIFVQSSHKLESRSSQTGCHVQRVSAITWQRRGRGLAAGGTQEFDVRGMKPASLTLLAPSLGGKIGETKSISCRFTSEFQVER